MVATKVSAILGALASAATVSAHGYVSHIIVDGVQYPGYNPTTHPYMSNPPTVVGWSADQLDLGFVRRPAKGHAQVKAGAIITFQWTTWPESHHGPIIDHLAACNGPCENVKKEDLRFFKIDGLGLITPGAAGYYAANKLMDNQDRWVLRIPSNIKPGNYVLRHEIIALHGSNSYDGTQSYPQCFNLEITGSGTDVFPGVPGTELYGDRDPGILINTYNNSLLDYPVPGGAIVNGGVSSIAQNAQVATSTGTPTPLAEPPPLPPPPRALPPAPPRAPHPYGQCGGNGWTGPTTCANGVKCTWLNDWYSQCTP
ncbi:unnamed protein product [Parascedosporium putredinis]|uniref:lytic cellulose monooxygenase (C4-dehydrogenating) n=1 Tax=Parascedosporium putredinis TaxID=1442378 RepID=A0A9P1M504_9PEZI|nr:unnamed protein product [Parascedosporium putredinis]CAI7987579.1 unnamed protein product [Parascedosporium putredinis]